MTNFITSTITSAITKNITSTIECIIRDAINKATKTAYSRTSQAILGSLSLAMNFSTYANCSEFYEVLVILKRINLKKFNQYSIRTRIGSTDKLKVNIRYIIHLDKINAYILVDTTDPDTALNDPANEMHLYFFGKGRNKALQLFLNTLKKDTDSKNNSKINKTLSITQVDQIDFKKKGNIPVKSKNQLFYDQDILNETISYISNWKKATDIFKNLNLTKKLGILLYGPPGTGKTSFAKAIAGYFSFELITMDVATFCSKTIENLNNLIITLNIKYSVVLLEDIDCIFTTRDNLNTSEEKSAAQLLLQFLDGVSSFGNIIIIATTNHIEKLDPALIRDGRFDKKIALNNISKEQAIKMCNSMFLKPEAVHSITANEKYPINPAYLQNKILNYIFSHLEEIKTIEKEDDENEAEWQRF